MRRSDGSVPSIGAGSEIVTDSRITRGGKGIRGASAGHIQIQLVVTKLATPLTLAESQSYSGKVTSLFLLSQFGASYSYHDSSVHIVASLTAKRARWSQFRKAMSLQDHTYTFASITFIRIVSYKTQSGSKTPRAHALPHLQSRHLRF